MLFNRYVFGILMTTLLSGTSLWLVLTRLDPYADESIAIPFFFVTLFFFAAGLLSLIGYLVRIALYQEELFSNHFNVSLRQGVLLSCCLSAFFGLQIFRTLSWWSGLLLVFLTLLIELYFVAKE